jgi:hypothetical protein
MAKSIGMTRAKSKLAELVGRVAYGGEHFVLILAHAERLRVYAIATLDRDWRRASAFDVYTCP